MRRCIPLLALVLIVLLSFLPFACDDDDDEDCLNIEGDWDFSVIELWDCDGNPETDAEEHGIMITQIDCDISFTGTFRKGLGGIMTGTISESSIEIDFYDDDEGCTLTIRAAVNDLATEMNGTWEDNCRDEPDYCNGESGTFTAVKE